MVVIDRPERRNAVDAATAAALYSAFTAFDDDPDAAVAVLTGAGDTFCAGCRLEGGGRGQGNRVTRTARGRSAPPGSS